MHLDLEARLMELLRADDEDHFRQGLEMLRSGGWTPPERFLVARALSPKPCRAIAAMVDDTAQERPLVWGYVLGCLRRLAEREAQVERPPARVFTQQLALLARLADGEPVGQEAVEEAVLACRAEAARLRARGRVATMAQADPPRYSAMRLLEVLSDLLEAAGPVDDHIARLMRQLASLEPRGILAYEERDRRAMCRDALEDALRRGVSPPSAPGPAPA